MSADVVGVLLAAGASSRFGGDKLLHPLDDGVPLAVRSARNLLAALPQSLAVVRDGGSALARALAQAGLGIVACPAAAEGMGASIACAVAARPQAAGWVICLADMPFVAPAIVSRVARALRDGAALAAPLHGGRRGHPVGFAQRFGRELLALRGDAGARGVLAAHAERIELLHCDDPGVLLDVDVPADLDAARGLG